jgi:threonine dehydrogenase-like Zn-dependent dehydrogenase
VELINHNHVDLSFLLSQSCSLYEAPAMFAVLARGESRVIKVIIEP